MKIGNPIDKATGGVSSQRTEGATSSSSTTGKTTTLDGGVSESVKVSLSPAAANLNFAATLTSTSTRWTRSSKPSTTGPTRSTPK